MFETWLYEKQGFEREWKKYDIENDLCLCG